MALLSMLSSVAKAAAAAAAAAKPKTPTTTSKNPTTGSGASTSSGRTTTPAPTGSYNVTTAAGVDLAQSLAPGASKMNSDGHVWTKNADGSITVTTPRGNKIPLTINGSAYSAPAVAPPLEQPIPQLAPNYGGGVLNTANSVLDRYTVDQLVQLFGPGVQASYDTLEQDAKKTMGVFDQSIFNIGNNNLEAVKRMQGTAATGQASQAAAGAQALSALMNTFMDASGTFTGLNQELQGLSGKKAEAMANLVPTAMQVKNTQDSNFANLFNSLYAADTQFGVGALDYLGNKYNADKNLEGNKYASDKNLEGTIQQALANIKASQYSGGGSGGGSAPYNPNATLEGYVSKAYEALANGNKGDFFFYMTQVGVEPNEAKDLYDIWYKEQKEKTGDDQKKPPQSAIEFFQKRLFDKNKPYNADFVPVPYNVLNKSS